MKRFFVACLICCFCSVFGVSSFAGVIQNPAENAIVQFSQADMVAMADMETQADLTGKAGRGVVAVDHRNPFADIIIILALCGGCIVILY